MRDCQVVALDAGGDDLGFASFVIRKNLFRAGGHGVQPTVGAQGLAIAALGVLKPEADLAIEPDLVGLAVRHVVEENFTAGICGWPLGKAIAFTDKLPLRLRTHEFLKLGRACACFDGLRPAFPEPPHGFRENLRGMFAVMAANSPVMSHFIAGEARGLSPSSWLAIHQSPP